MTLAARIRALRLELAALEQQQRDELLHLMTAAFPPGGVSSADHLWQQPELRTACLDAGLASAKQLGVWLQQSGFLVVKRANGGRLWSVSSDD